MIKPPEFWSEPEGGRHPMAVLLSPLAGLYSIGATLRTRFTKAEKLPKPVICVGNVTLGGVGKTPFTAMLARHLQSIGQEPHIISRGYGGSEKGPLKVEPHMPATRVGDEPLLLNQTAPTWVSADRARGGDEAIDAGADCLLLDDGFQNPRLHKDFSFLLIDGEEGFGNGVGFPAGPLRERPEQARDRADCLVFVCPFKEYDMVGPLRRFALDKPVLRAWLQPDVSAIDQTRPYVALCGIGRPQRFFATLENIGLNVVDHQALGDHQPFDPATIAKILAWADNHKAHIITTEKDWMRLPQDQRDQFLALPVTMQVDDPARLAELLTPVLDPPRKGG